MKDKKAKIIGKKIDLFSGIVGYIQQKLLIRDQKGTKNCLLEIKMMLRKSEKNKNVTKTVTFRQTDALSDGLALLSLKLERVFG